MVKNIFSTQRKLKKKTTFRTALGIEPLEVEQCIKSEKQSDGFRESSVMPAIIDKMAYSGARTASCWRSSQMQKALEVAREF